MDTNKLSKLNNTSNFLNSLIIKSYANKESKKSMLLYEMNEKNKQREKLDKEVNVLVEELRQLERRK